MFMVIVNNINVFAQNDLIIYRNGDEKRVKLVMVSSDEVTYKESTKGGTTFRDNLSDIYMLKFEKRGNVYITEEGKRKAGENQKIEKDEDVIYFIEGKEIPAYNVRISGSEVVYQTKVVGKGFLGSIKKTAGPITSRKLTDVFFIRYKDGTKDLINNLSSEYKEALNKARIKAEQQAQEEEEMRKINERKVIFHNVKKGETLSIIANRYHVRYQDIIEWNDLSVNLKQNAKLTPDMQLMIYVKKSNQ